MGSLKALAVDEEGKPLSGAEIWFDMGEETQFVRKTDQNGYAVLTGKAGSHTVGCIAEDNEHLPVKKEVILQSGEEITVRFVLTRQSIVEGSFEVHPMTFKEIEDAGLDISDPENQYMMQVSVKLDFSVSSSADIEPTELNMYYSPNSGKTTVSGTTTVIYPDGTRHELQPQVISSETRTDQPDFGENLMVAILDVPVSIRTVKEFFDVKLYIINHA